MSNGNSFIPKILLFCLLIILAIISYTEYKVTHVNLELVEMSSDIIMNYYYSRGKLVGKKPKIICWVCTHPGSSDFALRAHKLWANTFDKTIYVTNNAEKFDGLPTVIFPVEEESRHILWKKTMFAFRHLYTKYGDSYDWFMKADDDTYVVTENLYRFLSKYNASEPYYFGRELVLNGITYCSGGGGYIVSRAALKLFIGAIDNECKDHEGGSVEDLEFGRCLNKVGVFPNDSRDENGRYRFNFLTLRYHLLTPKGDLPEWVYTMKKYPIMEEEECCASDVITFHYMNEKEGNELYDLLLEPPVNLLVPSKMEKIK